MALALLMILTASACSDGGRVGEDSQTSTTQGIPVSIPGEEPDVIVRFEETASIAEMDRVGQLIVPQGSIAPFSMAMDFDDFRIIIVGDPDVSPGEFESIREAAATSEELVEVVRL